MSSAAQEAEEAWARGLSTMAATGCDGHQALRGKVIEFVLDSVFQALIAFDRATDASVSLLEPVERRHPLLL